MADRLSIMSMDVLNGAAECLKVMAHPVRLRIVDVLMQGDFAVHEIARLCNTSPDQTCEHLRLMKGHGLLTSERRGRTVYYKIVAPNLPGMIECIRRNCGEDRKTAVRIGVRKGTSRKDGETQRGCERERRRRSG